MAKEDEWKAMRVSGVLAWIHRFVMLITFPFRRFWQIMLVLLILLIIFLAVPLLQGIKFRDIWDWYMVKMPTHEFVEAKDKTSAKFSQRWRQVKNTVGEMIPSYSMGKKEKKEEEPERFVSWNVAAFRKAKYEPRKTVKVVAPKPAEEQQVKSSDQPILKWFKSKKKEVETDNKDTPVADELLKKDIIESKDEAEVAQEPVVNDTDSVKVTEEDYFEGRLNDYYIEKENLDLTYLPTAEKLFSKADVLGANSLYVGDTFLFLYGIYSDAQKYDVLAAKQYLTDLIGDRQVYCEVVAYTNQSHAATALCFVGGVFINKALVDNYFADNVALK